MKNIKEKMVEISQRTEPFFKTVGQSAALLVPFLQGESSPPLWVLANTEQSTSFAEHLVLESITAPDVEFHFAFTSQESIPYQISIYITEIDSCFTSGFILDNIALLESVINSQCIIVALGYRPRNGKFRVFKLVPVFLKQKYLDSLQKGFYWINHNSLEEAKHIAINYE